MTEPVRLAKRLAEMLSCSRREAEQYIEGGWVSVDGVVVEEPEFRVQNQASGGNLVLYLASDCPASTPGAAVIVANCLGASNRNANIAAYSASEEVTCLPLAAGHIPSA